MEKDIRVELVLENSLVPELINFVSTRNDGFFLHSNLLRKGVKDTGETYTGTYTVCFAGKEIVGVAGHFWTSKVILSVTESVPKEKIWCLVDLAVKSSPENRVFNGLLGSPEAIMSYLEIEGTLEEPADVHECHMYECRVDDVRSFTDGETFARLATKDDFENLVSLRKSFLLESFDNPKPNHKQILEFVSVSTLEKKLWVLEEKPSSQVVATAAVIADTSEKIMLGNVYTPKNLRNRGYARRLISGLILGVAKRNASIHTALLFADDPAAVKVYTSVGFSCRGKYNMHLFEKPIIKACTKDSH